MEPTDALLDVVIVGGGPAGLSAALLLGRCRRKVLVIDAGAPRNRAAHAAHGILTRDGAPPRELLELGRAQLGPYGVEVRDDEVLRVSREGAHFLAQTRKGEHLRSRKLLLATGMRDRLPERPGLADLFGKSVHVCPYCDGWEHRDRRLAAWARAADGATYALALLTWSDDVVLFTDGETLAPEERAKLQRNGVCLCESRVEALEGEGDALTAVRLEGGERVARDALFVHLGQEQAAPFARELGAELAENGTVLASKTERTTVPGLWIAGDAAHDLQLLAVAAAEGVKAACSINTELREERHR